MRANEERNDGKLSRSVLESSGSRKGVADFNIDDGNLHKYGAYLPVHLPILRM
jgi:hypothetical protein